MTENKKQGRMLSGQVVSDRMNKSRVVLIQRQVQHPLYGKYLRKSTKLHVHDEHNESKMGDQVVIQESRPISKTKSWVLLRIKGKDNSSGTQLSQKEEVSGSVVTGVEASEAESGSSVAE